MFSRVVGQTDIKERLLQEAQAGRVPHALLLSGSSGCGKLALAVSYAQYLLCHRPGAHDACGECPSCRTFTHFVHPDLHFVFPIIKYKTAESSVCDVYIDAWRKRLQAGLYFDLNDWLGDMKAENQQALIYAAEAAQIQRKLALKSTLGGRKAMIVWMPEKMNAECANKLLKLIEEPPEQTNFLLVSDEPEKILPTILSRTQQIEVKGIDHESLVEALRKNPSHGGRGSSRTQCQRQLYRSTEKPGCQPGQLALLRPFRHADAVELPTKNQGHAEMERTDCRHGAGKTKELPDVLPTVGA